VGKNPTGMDACPRGGQHLVWNQSRVGGTSCFLGFGGFHKESVGSGIGSRISHGGRRPGVLPRFPGLGPGPGPDTRAAGGGG